MSNSCRGSGLAVSNSGGYRLQRKTCSGAWQLADGCNNNYMYCILSSRSIPRTWMCVAPLASEVLSSPPEATIWLLDRSLLTMSYAACRLNGISLNRPHIGPLLVVLWPFQVGGNFKASYCMLWTFGRTGVRFDCSKVVSSVNSPWIFLRSKDDSASNSGCLYSIITPCLIGCAS